MAKTRCAEAGCFEISDSERCPRHTRSGDFRSSRTRGLTTTERGYGWRWQKAREVILAREPLCRPCKQAGRVSPATEVDHVVEKARGGTDDPDNLQPICKHCHDAKSRVEARGGPAVATSVTVVCGPPGAGKTTYVRERAMWGDLVVDVDTLWTALSGLPLYDKPDPLLPFVLACRDAIYDRLSRANEVRQAWVITGGAKSQDRAAWRQRGAKVVVIETQAAVAIARIRRDETRAKRAALLERLVRDWWAEYRRDDGDEIVEGVGGSRAGGAVALTVRPVTRKFSSPGAVADGP